MITHLIIESMFSWTLGKYTDIEYFVTEIHFIWLNAKILALWYMTQQVKKKLITNSNQVVYIWSFSSVQLSCSVMSDTLGPHEMQHSRPPCPSPTPGVHPNPCPLSQWCHPPSHPLSSSSPPALNLPQHQSLFIWVSSSHQVAKVLEFQL